MSRGRLVFLAVLFGASVACTLVNSLDRYQSGGPEPGDAGGVPESSMTSDADAERPRDDGGPSWKRYTYSLFNETWTTPVLLSETWIGPNAPPSRGITAVVELVDLDRLLVFADDGRYYVRADGEWRKPVAIGSTWAPMTSPPRSAHHVPFAFIKTVGGTVDEEGITLVDNPNYFIFRYKPNDAIIFQQTGTLKVEDGGPPATTGKVQWAFEIVDLQNSDPGARYRIYSLYDDGRLYEFRADFASRSWPIAVSPFWLDKANAAPTTGLAAAYVTMATSEVSFIGP
jgi:hypothetical protein